MLIAKSQRDAVDAVDLKIEKRRGQNPTNTVGQAETQAVVFFEALHVLLSYRDLRLSRNFL